MALNERQIERAARAYRDALIGTQIDDKAWAACREHWIADFNKFAERLTGLGVDLCETQTHEHGKSKTASTGV